jgi:hypothetical protein
VIEREEPGIMQDETRPGHEQPGMAVKARYADRRLTVAATVVVFMGLAFSLGYFRGTAELRSQQEAWEVRNQKASADAATSEREIARLRTLQVLWQIDAGFSDIQVHLAEKNFGMARDAAHSLSRTLPDAAALLDSLDAEKLAPLRAALDSIAREAEVLSPRAETEARDARDSLKSLIQGESS